MEIVFCLKKILEEKNDRGHGQINRICSYTKLERHLVAKLLQGHVRTISKDTLRRICMYLHDKHRVPAKDLPGILFAIEASEFWSMFNRKRVFISVGVRDVEKVEPRWVNAYDAFLLGVLLQEFFGVGYEEMSFGDQYLLPTFGEETDVGPTIGRAGDYYSDFHRTAGNRALVCLGSVKANPLVEHICGELFSAAPFSSEDTVDKPSQRRLPFYVCFRPEDPQPPSSHGGRRLARSKSEWAPGIYYESSPGKWINCPSTETEDSGFVLYGYKPHEGTLEMVLAGFSGRATGAIGLKLHELSRDLWPPQYVRDDLQIGLFIVRFTFKPESERPTPDSQDRPPNLVNLSGYDVIRVPVKSIEARLGKAGRTTNRPRAKRDRASRSNPPAE